MERSDLFSWLTTHGVRIVAILAFAFLATRLARLAVRRIESRLEGSAELTLEQSLQRRATLGNVLTSVARVAVWSLAVLMLLGEVGVNLAPVVAGAGIAGVAFGFGAQHLVKDVLAGFFMLVENQFQVGNLLEIQTNPRQIHGRVERLSLRSTWLRTFDGTLHVVPNGTIMFIGNRSRGWARAIVDVSLPVDTNPETARRELERVIEEISKQGLPGVMSGPRVLGIERLDDGMATFRVVAETRPSTRFDVERELRRVVARKLEELRSARANGSR
jgi:moderate conductance mechanosensitive channel